MANAKKILIIEDEEYLADIYKLKISTGGFDVSVAIDGEEGVKKAKEILPDLVLLDIVLPKKNGYEVLRTLREDKTTKNLKIFILSNLGQSAEIKKGMEGGADGYWVKASLTPQQLLDNVKKVI
jgi:DNA-binding response OmpR family regulator